MAARKLYWDTGVFLCFLNPDEESRRRVCEDILRNAQRGEVVLYTSTFTIAEVIRPKRMDGRSLTPEQISQMEKMFRWKWLKKVDVGQRIASKAVELARERNLKAADSVHAATAILHSVDALQHWDKDFRAVQNLINVEEPRWMTAQLMLIDPPRIGLTHDDLQKPLKER
jgi:predicted nucleic acid-binding protein